MNATIIYHSVTGNTKKMAELIADTMNAVGGIAARTFPIQDVDVEFVKSSKCVIIGTPIYTAGATADIHNFLQNSLKEFELEGKLGGAFATANYVHGGGEQGIHSILDAMMCRGMMVYSGGAAFGVPVVHLGPVALGTQLDFTHDIFVEYAKRMANKSFELFGKI